LHHSTIAATSTLWTGNIKTEYNGHKPIHLY
jgi:hypothetical protein